MFINVRNKKSVSDLVFDNMKQKKANFANTIIVSFVPLNVLGLIVQTLDQTQQGLY